MKFKCNTSGCVYSFESALDIKAMQLSQDYTQVVEVEVVPVQNVPVVPTTVVPVSPVAPGPDKPLPMPVKPAKAV
jgi:hypothetical protein